MDIGIRRAGPADVPGLVALSAALFAEDGATRDRLRNAGWPQDNGYPWIEGLLATPEALVLVAADHDGTGVGYLIGRFYAVSAMWTGARTELISTYVVPGTAARTSVAAWSRRSSPGAGNEEPSVSTSALMPPTKRQSAFTAATASTLYRSNSPPTPSQASSRRGAQRPA
jgi:hypothetical protein